MTAGFRKMGTCDSYSRRDGPRPKPIIHSYPITEEKPSIFWKYFGSYFLSNPETEKKPEKETYFDWLIK
jgi:hypothetical protein